MTLRKGHNMKLWWKRLIFPVAGMTVVGLVGVTLAASRTQISARSAIRSFGHSNEEAAPRGVVSLGDRALALAGGQAGAAERPKMAEEVFKNVQALKGITVDDFMLTMGIMTSSLAFDCSDCHDKAGTTEVDWADDKNSPSNRKVIARRMVLMVQEINKTNFGGRQMVSCFTCHRNRDRPLTTPTMEMLYGEAVVEPDDFLPRGEATPSADQVFDKYIAAIGGAQRVGTLTSYLAKATSEGFGGFGGTGTVTIYAKAPDKRSTIIEFKQAAGGRDDNARTFDGRTGWIRTPLSVLGEYEITGSERDGARLDAQVAFPTQIKTSLRNWRVSGTFSRISDREVWAVQGDGPRGTFATFYFDKENGMLLRMLRYGPSPIGRIPTQVDYSDYRDVGGIKFPFKWSFAWLDGRDTITLSEIRTNVPIDDARFGKPSTAKQ